MYGDWSQDRLHSWMKVSSGYSLTPIMQMNNTPGKNASDICLIIDAMDILYGGDVQGFCIASSDGDFNKLATRLREAGKVVIGMGEKKTPESFRSSCERFIFLDVINNDDEDEAPAKKQPKKKAQQQQQTKNGKAAEKAASRSSKKAEKTPEKEIAAETSQGIDDFLGYTPVDEDASDGENSFTDQEAIEAAIVKMITDNAADGKETGLGEIGSRIVKIFPDFDVRNYHYSKLSEYLKDLPSLSITSRDSGSWVSLKITSDQEIERQILQIFRSHQTDDMNISTLKQELQEINPNLDATISKSGVTRFSVYLNRRIPSVLVNGRHVIIKGSAADVES